MKDYVEYPSGIKLVVQATNQFSCINCTHVLVCPVSDKVQCKTLDSKLTVLVNTEFQFKFLV